MIDNEFIPVETRTENDAVRAIMEHYAHPVTATAKASKVGDNDMNVLFAPAGLHKVDLTAEVDRLLVRPRRLKGQSVLTTLESFIAMVNRYRGAESVVFANDDRKSPSMTAVFNYNSAVERNDVGEVPAVAEFGDHRAHYAFPLSDEWKAWLAANGAHMTMGQFSEFLEERIVDVLGPNDTGDSAMLRNYLELTKASIASPNQLLTLSAGLRIHESTKVGNAVNLSSGEGEISFVSENLDEQGEKLKVPNTFMVGLPVFRGGAAYRLAARLRYRKSGPNIVFWFDLWRHDVAFDDAVNGAVEKVHNDTELPVLFGKPEA